LPISLDLRVEVVTPVTDPDLTGRLQEILDVMLADNTQAWELLEDGSWQRRQPAEGERRVATHRRLRGLRPPRGLGGCWRTAAASGPSPPRASAGSPPTGGCASWPCAGAWRPARAASATSPADRRTKPRSARVPGGAT